MIVWRVFGWITTAYLVLCLMLLVFFTTLPDINLNRPDPRQSGVRLDYIILMKLAKPDYWFTGLTIALTFAPIGFFRRSLFRPARLWLILYIVPTAFLTICLLGASTYLAIVRVVPMRNGMIYRIYYFSDAVGFLVASSILIWPVIPAFIAACRADRIYSSFEPIRGAFPIQSASGPADSVSSSSTTVD